MQIASEKGHTDVVKVLLEHNADPNITDEVSCSLIKKTYSLYHSYAIREQNGIFLTRRQELECTCNIKGYGRWHVSYPRPHSYM